uniref:Sulfotransferase n=1 Tax=Arundo donax TaxID=35708 RepID=A0A0A8YD67_ARUDO
MSSLGCRVVYLCREPKDVLVSTWHYMNKVRKDFYIDLDRAFEFFCEGVSIFGPIWEHNLGYWKQSMIEPDRVLFLKYDEMMADPIKHVKMLAKFLRVPFTDEEESVGAVEQLVKLCSFENLKSLPVNSSGMSDRIGGLPMENSSFFRSAKVGDWRNHLTEEMAKKLDCIIEEKLKGSGLTF